MTDSTPATPIHPTDETDAETPIPTQRPAVTHGRPRSVEGEEAYERSRREQAAIDIAAGW
ncbi:hypothetical protein SAMN04515671_0674 [Nakamurella panacisegetis]|uniref:Uncharacterized protein n=1 Tax=Nakamurella panacisegetis TaxID=1090615 RepID=A0A1H0IW89_9ACTN|nr:hypothetical protein [Nakamurella panacisegetis]SDO35559.1 hypothetical protein SAMN04515671_0674 [Nakamurella panacisegetis]